MMRNPSNGERDSGLEVIGRVPWGAHFCTFYETTQDLLDVVVPFFKAGLENKEFCLWIISDSDLLTMQEGKSALRNAFPDFDRDLSEGRIELLRHDQWFLEKGLFNIQRVAQRFDEKEKAALAAGYAGMRVNGSPAWLYEKNGKEIVEFEEEVDKLYPHLRVIASCTYPITESGATELLDIARAHQFVLTRRQGTWELFETPEVYQAKSELAKLNAELEERVLERTRELAAANEELRESDRLMRLVLKTLPVGVVVTDKAGTIVLVNDASKRIWGGSVASGPERWTQTKAYWHDSGERIAPENWPSVRALSKGETSLNQLVDVETYDGQRKIMNNSVAPIHNAQGVIIGAVIVNEDVTDRVRAQDALQDANQKLRRLSKRLFKVQEDEKRHLARELHDHMAQSLTAAKINLQTAQQAQDSSEIEPKLQDSITILDQLFEQVRKLSLDLRSPLLDDLGLVAALRSYLDQQAQRAGLRADFFADPALDTLSPEVQTACFRVAQEAVTNIVRHSKAENIWLELRQQNNELHLVVRDDGSGFDPAATLAAAEQGKSLGLLGMRERVELFGGRLDLHCRPGEGTELHAFFPLEPLT